MRLHFIKLNVMTFGEKIQALRKQAGLSQENLAEKLDITRQTVSKWELDQSTPELGYIAKLADLYNVSTDYLIRDDAQPLENKNISEVDYPNEGIIEKKAEIPAKSPIKPEQSKLEHLKPEINNTEVNTTVESNKKAMDERFNTVDKSVADNFEKTENAVNARK